MYGFTIKGRFYTDLVKFCENEKLHYNTWDDRGSEVDIEFKTEAERAKAYEFYARMLELEKY